MRPFANQAIEAIRARKMKHLKTSDEVSVQAWDQTYYLPPPQPTPVVSLPRLTVGTTFVALSRLFNSLYGITLRPSDASMGEVWSSDVRKLEVVDESRGILGYIYTDLYARGVSGHGAAHFTLRGTRLLDEEDLALPGNNSRIGFAVKRPDGIWQLPIVALLCGFRRSSGTKSSDTLDWQEINTLFHEMGHAIHCKSSASI
jgi:mitochondrial intermediate peptidase